MGVAGGLQYDSSIVAGIIRIDLDEADIGNHLIAQRRRANGETSVVVNDGNHLGKTLGELCPRLLGTPIKIEIKVRWLIHAFNLARLLPGDSPVVGELPVWTNDDLLDLPAHQENRRTPKIPAPDGGPWRWGRLLRPVLPVQLGDAHARDRERGDPS